jgi:hypothetical protein
MLWLKEVIGGMSRVKVLLKFGFFAVVGLLMEFPQLAAQNFEKEPELYFDLGEASQFELTSESKRELLSMIKRRGEELERELSNPDSLGEAVLEFEAHLKRSKSYFAQMVGMGCAIGAACVAGYLFASVLPSSVMQREPWLSAFIILGHSGLWAFNIGALGFGLAMKDGVEEKAIVPKVFLDLRSRSILEAAQDVSAQMRAMAVPLSFWSIRRLRDFTYRFLAFQALERLILEMEIEKDSDFERVLKLTGSQKKIVDDEWAADWSDVQKKKVQVEAIRALRRLELATLRVMEDGMADIGGPMPIDEWVEKDCLAMIKLYMKNRNSF